MAMSRKHYREVAEIIKNQVEVAGRDDLGILIRAARMDDLRSVAGQLAVMFKQDNSAFDRQKFMSAAGLTEV